MIDTTPAGLTFDLIFAALTTGFIGLFIIARSIPPRLSIPISAFKVTLPTVYFAWFYTGHWNIIDDITYAEQSVWLLSAGYTPISILLPQNSHILMSIADGRHVLYYWWNMVAMTLFGQNYYAPVFLNVLLTFGIAIVFVNILRNLGYSRTYRRWGLVFMLLHWDIVAWSSLLNVKDILVLFLTVCILYGFVLVFSINDRRDILRGVLLIITGSSVLWWLRFYVPFLIVLAAVGYLMVHEFRKWYFVPASLIVGLSIPFLDRGLGFLDRIDPSNYLLGFIQFLLTPRPWGINPSYSFLIVPSTVHWLLAPIAAFGALNVVRTSRIGRFLVFYAIIVVCFFSVVPVLIGPRHRLQMSIVLAWLQFHGLWTINERVEFRLGEPSRRVDRPKSSH